MKANARSAVKVAASLNVSKKQVKSITPIVIKWLLVLLSCMGSVFTFLSAFELPAGRIAVSVTLVIFCTAFSLTLNMKPGLRGTASVCASAVFLLLVGIFRNDICAGLANTVNTYLARIRWEFRENPIFVIAEPESTEFHVTVFLCFFAAFISIASAYMVSREWYAAGLCIPPMIMPIAVLMFGLEPDYFAFAAVVCGCAAAIALEISSTEKIGSARYRYAASYSGLAAAAFAAVCFAASAVTVKLSGYQRSERIDEIYNSITGYIERGEMKNVFDDVVTLVSKESGRSGAINHGKLGEFDEIYFDGKTVLQVTLPEPDETVYLRGFVGSVYTGNSWKPLPSGKQRELEEIYANFTTDGLSALLFDGYSLKNSGSSMSTYTFYVKNISAGREFLYMPYNLVPESVSRYTEEAGGGFSGGEDTYFGLYYDPSGNYGYQSIFRMRWKVSSAMSADEAAYRQFVYDNYLDLPEDYTRVAEIFDESYYEYITREQDADGNALPGKSTLDEMTVFSRKLYYIRSWLRNNCEYSLSAGKLPRGRDFVDHFLENRKGSCSHFASTAVLMCRYAGIPARYVEGYIIKPSADFPSGVGTATIDITDSRAHAWVEIYIDGFGWYPMEFTSGYGNVRTAIPTETTTVTETETETEPVLETTAVEVEASEASAAENSSQEADQQQSQQDSEASGASEASGEESIVTAPPAEMDGGNDEASEASRRESSTRPSVGFGIFGMQGGSKVDVVYDITVPVLAAVGILLILAAFAVRRRVCLLLYRRKCSSGKKIAAIASYRKFCRIVRIMKLPEQGELGSTEYAEMLSGRSPVLSDGTAECVMQTALKASFGGDSLTENDAREAVFAVSSLTKRYYTSLSKAGRLKLKYIYCLL